MTGTPERYREAQEYLVRACWPPEEICVLGKLGGFKEQQWHTEIQRRLVLCPKPQTKDSRNP